MVSFVMALFLVTTVSAIGYDIVRVDVDDVEISNAAITAGETIKVEVWFNADFGNVTEDDGEDFYDRDVIVEVELDTGKDKTRVLSKSMVVENGETNKITLTLKVPHELDDKRSEEVTLEVNIDGDRFEVDEKYDLRVKRPQYIADIKSVTVPQTVKAGETIPVNIVLKNVGYNELDDLYVSVTIPALGVESTGYFGDLVSLECCDNDDDCCNEDDKDTVSGKLYLEVPYDVEAGIYTLEVNVENEDMSSSMLKQVIVGNEFPNSVIVTSYKKTVAVGEDAEYNLLLVNPTNSLKVYRIISESSGDMSTSVRDAVVAVPAGSSKTITVIASSNTEGEYNFDVNVLSGNEITETVTLTLSTQDSKTTTTTNPVVVLTIVLAIVFLVLLVVLIVLITKKPETSEEFGESYY